MTAQEVQDLTKLLTARYGLTERVDGELSKLELFWRDHSSWLEERGYMLRSRYKMNWVPSWLDKRKHWSRCEDGQRPSRSYMLDATRLSDGSYVMLKIIHQTAHPFEVPIGSYFSSEERASDPRNHCVRIYDVLRVPDEEDTQILVMPMLRKYNNPSFEIVAEAVDFFRQTLEGLQYMHENRVAHRDCNGSNIMMDPTGLYPDSYHPVAIDKTRDFRNVALHTSRTHRPPRYYFIDFGISRQYNPQDIPPSEPIIQGGDKTVPEHKDLSASCDPFPTDVYYLGNMIRRDFLQAKRGFDFMQPLVAAMTQDDPAKRPTMDDVVARFEKIAGMLDKWTLGSRVADRNEFVLTSLVRGVPHVGMQVGSMFKERIPFFRRRSGKPAA